MQARLACGTLDALKRFTVEAEQLCNARQLAYCRAYVFDNLNSKEAFVSAGYTSKHVDQQAARVLAQSQVVALVAAYRETTRRKSEVTHGYLVNESKALLERALSEGNLSVARATLADLSKLSGNMPKESLVIEDARPTVDTTQLNEGALASVFQAKREEVAAKPSTVDTVTH